MAGMERLKRAAMFVPIEGGFQRKSEEEKAGLSVQVLCLVSLKCKTQLDQDRQSFI
jgi:hypothetical protein